MFPAGKFTSFETIQLPCFSFYIKRETLANSTQIMYRNSNKSDFYIPVSTNVKLAYFYLLLRKGETSVYKSKSQH
jgi:hypothetical protein